jgi:hypothetical protein
MYIERKWKFLTGHFDITTLYDENEKFREIFSFPNLSRDFLITSMAFEVVYTIINGEIIISAYVRTFSSVKVKKNSISRLSKVKTICGSMNSG